jgi:hypothetical protein
MHIGKRRNAGIPSREGLRVRHDQSQTATIVYIAERLRLPFSPWSFAFGHVHLREAG